MIAAHLPALVVVVPLVAAPLIVLLRHPGLAWALAVAAAWFSFGGSLALAAQVADAGVVSYAMGNWPPPWGIEYRVDALSAFVLVLVSGVGAAVAPYALRSVAAEVPKSAGTRVKASRSSLIKTWRVMPITLPKVSMR